MRELRSRGSRRALFAAILAVAAACGPRAVDLTGASFALQRDPSGLTSADFRPYRLVLLGDGSWVFTCEGRDGVERTSRGSVAVDELQELARAALDLGFFALEDRYGRGYNDQIAVTLDVRLEASAHRVVCVAPFETRAELLARGASAAKLAADAVNRELHLLADRIDRLVGTKRVLAELIAAEPR